MKSAQGASLIVIGDDAFYFRLIIPLPALECRAPSKVATGTILNAFGMARPDSSCFRSGRSITSLGGFCGYDLIKQIDEMV